MTFSEAVNVKNANIDKATGEQTMELNREQIIKALECCLEENYCATCPAIDYCGGVDNLTEKALSLINELTEENERLKEINKELCEESNVNNNH